MKKQDNMKNFRNIVVVVVGFIGIQTASFGQQMPQTNLYNENVFNVNPAYAGYNPSCLEAYVGHITQWVGVEGAPSTNYLDIHKGIGKKFGIGGGFILDKTNMINRFSGNVSGSYRIGINEHSNIRVGLSLGLYQVSINTSKAVVQDPTDEIINGSTSGMTLNNELGLLYNYKKFILGVAVPQVFETDAKYDVQTSTASFGVNRHFTVISKYGWDVSDKVELEPSALMKRVTNVNQFDLNLMGTYNDLIGIGIGYRTDVGLLARLKLKLQEMFILGYAYEFAGSNISSYSSGSHEIMLGIKFCKEKQAEQPRFESAIPPPPIEEPEPEPVAEEPVVEPEPVAEEPVIEPAPAPGLSAEEKEAVNKVVGYDLGNSNYSASQQAKVDRIIEVLKAHPEVTIEISGHSCDIGSDERKEIVSKLRADKIKAYMVKNGIDENRISTKGEGDLRPMVPNTDDDNRSLNRRVDFKIIE